MWDVPNVRCSGGEMFVMSDVWNVGSLGCAKL